MGTTGEFVKVSPIDFLRSFVLQSFGSFDPTATLTSKQFVKTFATQNGACSVSITKVSGGVEIRCVGEDADQIQTELAKSFSVDDDHDGFAPPHTLLTRLNREQPGLRLIRVPWLFDIACSAVLQQRVRSTDAMKDWRRIAEKHGTRTAEGAIVFPSSSQLASLPAWKLESLGIDQKRSRTLIALAREIKLSPLRATMTFSQLRARLARIVGVGPWTVETVLGFGAADLDALPLGDLYLPHLVTYALAGEVRGSDARMIELLEPFRGCRFRIVRLLYGSKISVPRTYEPGRQDH